MVPHFLIIGVQRGGTTSLYDYLTQHPKIAAAKRKEVHYFDLNYMKGPAWYRAQFPWWRRVRPGTITGEASPYYVFHPAVRDRVKEALPAARLILLVRDPVDRAYSHYHLALRRKHEELPFAEAVQAEPSRLEGEAEKLLDPAYESFAYQHHTYVSRGHYAVQLRHWLEVFEASQIRVIGSEEFFADPAATLATTFDFLGVKPFELESFPHRNLGGYSDDMDPSTKAKLIEHYRPHNEALYELIGRDLGWSR